MAHLHIGAIILEICRCAPTQGSSHLPTGAAELSRLLNVNGLADEAFGADQWIVKNGALAVQVWVIRNFSYFNSYGPSMTKI